MSAEYEGQDPIKLAQQAERDLNSSAAKQGHELTDTARGTAGSKVSSSTEESGVDQSVENKFPGSTVTYGSAASGAGNNREIPVSEGGSISASGQPTKAGDFEGAGGPEDKAQAYRENYGGENEIRGNVRQGGDTIRPS